MDFRFETLSERVLCLTSTLYYEEANEEKELSLNMV